MPKLDLHGFTYVEAESQTLRFIDRHVLKKTWRVEIVTGKSKKMKEVVRKCCKEYDVDVVKDNMGDLIVETWW